MARRQGALWLCFKLRRQQWVSPLEIWTIFPLEDIERLIMKSVLSLAGLILLFGAAIFVAIVSGAVLAHFTHSILGAVATFPFAVGMISLVRAGLSRREASEWGRTSQV
jgi:hypothetical protein